MKMSIKLVFLSVLFILVITTSSLFLVKQRKTPNISQGNIENTVTTSLTISDIKEKRSGTGEYTVEGYVVKRYTCPLCPKGAQCKPCMRNNLVISENNTPLETYTLSNKELIVFTENTNQFELKKRYVFTIKITDSKSTGEPLNDVELISFK